MGLEKSYFTIRSIFANYVHDLASIRIVSRLQHCVEKVDIYNCLLWRMARASQLLTETQQSVKLYSQFA